MHVYTSSMMLNDGYVLYNGIEVIVILIAIGDKYISGAKNYVVENIE